MPVHRALLHGDYDTVNGLLPLIRANLGTVNELDEDGDTALKIILSHKCKGAVDSEAVVLLLEATLPFDSITGEPSPVDVERPGWVDAVQHDEATVVKAVNKVLEKYSSSIRDLACAVDAKGRSCLDIACPTCKTMMLKKLYLHERYEVQLGPPEHRSATSAVYFAKDHINMVDNNVPCEEGSHTIKNRDHSPSIALKFMKNRDQFERETGIRAMCKFENSYVLDYIRCYNGDAQDEANVKFRKDAILKGYEEYPYCVVMEAGTMSLKRLIDNQNVAGKDWDAIRSCTKQVAKALHHLHERGVIHGDLKGSILLCPWNRS